MCVGCLEAFARRLYRAPLRFEVEETSATTGSISFVDKEIVAGWDDLHVLRKDPNKDYVVGLEDKPKKIRYPAFLGPGFLRPRKLRSWLRATMFAELSSECEEQQRLGTVRCVAELQLQGYPNQVLKKAVAGVTQTPIRRLRAVAQKYLRLCKMQHGFGAMKREDVHEVMFDLHVESYARWALVREAAQATKPQDS